ncbi:hypothetical protein FBY14_12428 [Azospirillum brasilense]|nr:hypothetical protein FBY14_12428 [Azospirillum brasilense]
MSVVLPDALHLFRPGDRVEARRRTQSGLQWERAIVAARGPYGYLTRFCDGTEAPRPLADVRAFQAPPQAVAPSLPAPGGTVLFSPYDETAMRGCLEFSERATLESIDTDTATVIVASNSVCQYRASLANADGVRRVTVPTRQLLPNVAVIGRRVLISDHAMFSPRYVPGTITDDWGNVVVVQMDDRAGTNGRFILAPSYVYTRHGRRLTYAMEDEARGRGAWETDFMPDLRPEMARDLERAAVRLDALEQIAEAEALRIMATFPPLDLVLSPQEAVRRITARVDELERPTLDLSVKGLTATVTVMRRDGSWGFNLRYSHKSGSMSGGMDARDQFRGTFQTRAEAFHAGIDALTHRVAPSGEEFSCKAQQAAAKRFSKRVQTVRLTIS